MMRRINFTVEQARKVVRTCPPGSHYFHEALRVLREHDAPLPSIDVPGVDQYDDDGYPD